MLVRKRERKARKDKVYKTVRKNMEDEREGKLTIMKVRKRRRRRRGKKTEV